MTKEEYDSIQSDLTGLIFKTPRWLTKPSDWEKRDNYIAAIKWCKTVLSRYNPEYHTDKETDKGRE